MSTTGSDAVPPPVALTTQAAERLLPLLDTGGADAQVVRVAVEPGGCAGLRYTVTFDEATDPGTDVAVDSHGVRIRMDPAAEPLLRGAVIDFGRAGFSVRNPNARGACACGATFAGPLGQDPVGAVDPG